MINSALSRCNSSRVSDPVSDTRYVSLISQNAIPNNKREKPVEEPPVAAADGSALADAVGANELGAKQTVSKKKRSREVDEKSRMEKEKEKEKEKESSLFVPLYAPLEFGKEVGRDTALFSVDKSTGDEKAVYEEDLEAQAEKEEIREERKLPCVDEEGEKAKINIVRVRRLRKLRMEPGEKVVSGITSPDCMISFLS